MVSVVLMPSWVRSSLVVLEDWYVDALGFFLANLGWTLTIQPPSLNKDMHKHETIQKMVMFLGLEGFLLNEEGGELGGIICRKKFNIC